MYAMSNWGCIEDPLECVEVQLCMYACVCVRACIDCVCARVCVITYNMSFVFN
jgi:hypothetical protein